MKRINPILLNTCIVLNVLLVFLLAFENRVWVPNWLQVLGRMHPLVLHFPIVLVVAVGLAGLYFSFRKKSAGTEWLATFLLLAAVLAAVSALSGFILSLENVENGKTLLWHKWTGTGLSLLIWIWAGSYYRVQKRPALLFSLSMASVLLVTLVGHLGANITHGENFLTGPLIHEKPEKLVAFEDALVYDQLVEPILSAKCMNCHNESKAKGELMMQTQELLLKGGKSGVLWDLKADDLGLMMQRLHLPEESKKHMPPVGKPQLNDQEMEIIRQWLLSGASFTKKISEFSSDQFLYQAGKTKLGGNIEETYTFSAADPGKIASLTAPNLLVAPIAINSPALAADFYGRSQYKPEQLKNLLAVKDQLVSINLNKMPVTDEELATVASFTQLRHLNLGFTDITDKGLALLQKLPLLQQLTVSGTAVSAKGLEALAKLDKLSSLSAWETKVKESDRNAVSKALPNAQIQWGFNGDTLVMQLNPPIIKNEEQVIAGPTALQISHFLPGVSIRYTTDGSEPDSSLSPEYKEGVTISEQTTVKTRAFKQGWQGSATAQMTFFRGKLEADSIWLLQPADEAYRAKPGILQDRVKSETNFRNGKWLGFRQNDCDIMMRFKQTEDVSNVNLSSIIDIASYIFPPRKIMVWGGNDPTHLQLIGSTTPVQPTRQIPVYPDGFSVDFPKKAVKYLRVQVSTVRSLPAWHPGKGDKGWFFTDEIFVN